MLQNQVLQHRTQLRLDHIRAPKLPATAPVLPSDPFKLLVILQKEPQPLVTDIHVQIGPQLLLLLPRLPSSRERVILNLALYIRRRIREEDRRVGIAAAHLALRALQRGEEFRVHERGLAPEGMMPRHELVGDVAREAKVRILIDRARYEAREGRGVRLTSPQYPREGAAEGRSRLDGGEGRLADVGRAVEAEDAVYLIHGNGLPDPDDVGIHRPYVIEVGK
mmetsp:Transcript_30924/g.74736  ORF Transcript_30924/g.74736 Transcript_30924/m.74736 type:complete len:222 (+) Transcript_30924:339-1004(+)